MTDISRYDRQWRLREIGKEGQSHILAGTAAVIGLGALGSVSASLLARAGVGRLLLIDRDFPELSNLQRQTLYDEKDVERRLPKAVIAREKLALVNSAIHIEAFPADVNAVTAGELLAGVDVIVDGTDNYETRYLLNDFSLKHNIPWVYGGVIRTEGIVYTVLPGEGPCLRCLFLEAPAPEEAETCDRSGVLAMAAHVTAAVQAVEALKILAGKKEQVSRELLKFDVWRGHWKTMTVDGLPACASCRGHYEYLETEAALQTVKMCGRNAVQIYHAESRPVNFQSLAGKLAGQVAVEYNDYVMSIRSDPFEIMLFANGRAIVKGTEDAGRAKSLYARFVGA